MARRTPRRGSWKKRYQSDRGGPEVAIWGYLKLGNPDDLAFIGFAKQEGDQANVLNHAESRWLALHRGRLEVLLARHGKRVAQIEFDLTKEPCTTHCRPVVFPEIRRVCTANLSDR